MGKMRAALGFTVRAPGTAWCLAALVASRLLAYTSFCVFDDAFITYRYGSELAAGHGFIYNPGETILGTTSPLFGLLCATVSLFAGAPEIVIPLANIAVDVLAAVLVLRYFLAGERLAQYSFIAIFAISPMLARTCVGGMEVDVFFCLTLVALSLKDAGHWRLAAILAALSYFIRPEAVVTVAVLGVLHVLARKPTRAIATGLLAAVTVAPGLAAIWLYYGDVVPQSVAAKSHLARLPAAHVLHLLLAPEPIAALITFGAALGTIAAVRRAGTLRGPALWFWLYAGAYALGAPHVWSWYSFAPLAMGAVIAAAAAGRAMSKIARWPILISAPWLSQSTPAVVAVTIGAFSVAQFVFFGPDRVTQNIYRPVARFCQSISPSSRLLASDIGIVGFRCVGKIIDAAGLVTPAALSYRSEWDLIDATRPDFAFLTAADLAGRPADERFASAYQPVRRFGENGDPDPGHLRSLPGHWAQEYVLFQRRRTAP